MRHTDGLVTKVTRNKFNEMLVTTKFKQEDYTLQDFETLHLFMREAVTVDQTIGQSASINPQTGEIKECKDVSPNQTTLEAPEQN